MHVCLSVAIPQPLSFRASSAGNEKQTCIRGNSDSIKNNNMKKGPRGIVADYRLNGSACEAAVVTKDMVVSRKGHGVTFLSGTCAGVAGALCPALWQKKSCRIGSSLEKSQRDERIGKTYPVTRQSRSLARLPEQK